MPELFTLSNLLRLWLLSAVLWAAGSCNHGMTAAALGIAAGICEFAGYSVRPWLVRLPRKRWMWAVLCLPVLILPVIKTPAAGCAAAALIAAELLIRTNQPPTTPPAPLPPSAFKLLLLVCAFAAMGVLNLPLLALRLSKTLQFSVLNTAFIAGAFILAAGITVRVLTPRLARGDLKALLLPLAVSIIASLLFFMRWRWSAFAVIAAGCGVGAIEALLKAVYERLLPAQFREFGFRLTANITGLCAGAGAAAAGFLYCGSARVTALFAALIQLIALTLLLKALRLYGKTAEGR